MQNNQQNNPSRWIIEHLWLPLIVGIVSAIVSGVVVFLITSAINEKKLNPSNVVLEDYLDNVTNLELGDYLDGITEDMTFEEMLRTIYEQIESLHKENDALHIENAKLEEKYLTLNDLEKSYSNLQELYNILENQNARLSDDYNELQSKYQTLLQATGHTDPSASSASAATTKLWIDQLDIFYHEGRHKSGSNSDGWHKIWDSSFQKDSLGDEHNHGIYVRGYREDMYILEYILDEAYSGLAGLFTLEYESRNTQIESNLKVYSIDENNEKGLLYSTEQPLYGGVRPIPFDFPIYGADHIRIEISSGSGSSGEFHLALVDTFFYK